MHAQLHDKNMIIACVALGNHVVTMRGSAPSHTSPHHLRRKARAMAGSVEKMATGTARSDVGVPCRGVCLWGPSAEL